MCWGPASLIITVHVPKLRAVDELSLQESANRKGLADVTIELQIISKDVNKLISDTDVASRNLVKTQEALARFDQSHARSCTSRRVSSSFPFPSFPPPVYENLRQQLIDILEYLYSSMDKQKMWLHNYRDRKDIAMSLVFNLVTQQDAANNMKIATEMKRDSSSMNGIALLTMIFLPGTFTSVSARHASSLLFLPFSTSRFHSGLGDSELTRRMRRARVCSEQESSSAKGRIKVFKSEGFGGSGLQLHSHSLEWCWSCGDCSAGGRKF